MFGNEYKVVNKIDGYEFKVPIIWHGLEKIEYTPEIIEKDYTGSNLTFTGKEGGARSGSIDRFYQQKPTDDLELWARANFESFGLIGEFSKDTIQNINVVKTQENTHLGGMYIYFFQNNSQIYAITNGSEEYIHGILATGRW